MTEKIGKYVVIEGHDGTGKTTQIDRIRERLSEHSITSIELHEPASEENESVLIAAALRKIIKNGSLERDALTNLFLFSASRRELWRQLALPALERGEWVVAARNYYSTLAYQGYGEGLDIDVIHSMTKQATDKRYIKPDIAVILNLDDESERQKRIESRGELQDPDTFESKGDEFQQKVKDAYLAIAHSYEIPVLSASKSKSEVTDDIWNIIKQDI